MSLNKFKTEKCSFDGDLKFSMRCRCLFLSNSNCIAMYTSKFELRSVHRNTISVEFCDQETRVKMDMSDLQKEIKELRKNLLQKEQQHASQALTNPEISK